MEFGLGGGGGFGDTTARRPKGHSREVLPLISDMPGWSPRTPVAAQGSGRRETLQLYLALSFEHKGNQVW
jgi:hypothetical protein